MQVLFIMQLSTNGFWTVLRVKNLSLYVIENITFQQSTCSFNISKSPKIMIS